MQTQSRSSSRIRLQRIPVLLAIAGCILCALQSSPQAPSASSTAPRDAASLQLLTKALNLSGGVTIWQSIHGARVIGNMTLQTPDKLGDGSAINTFVWLDDWSTGHPRYNRATTNSAGSTHTLRHGDSTTSTAHTLHGATRTIKFDPTSVLLTHLPAAALVKILSDTSYSVVKRPQPNDPDHNEVLVSKLDGSTAQIWYLSNQTGQVDAVRYTVPDALNTSKHFWNMAVYKHYRADGELSVPDRVTIMGPSSVPIGIELKSFEANPTVSASDFSGGGGQ